MFSGGLFHVMVNCCPGRENTTDGAPGACGGAGGVMLRNQDLQFCKLQSGNIIGKQDKTYGKLKIN